MSWIYYSFALYMTIQKMGYAFEADNQEYSSSRVLNGTEADIKVFPYVASVRFGNAHICGGSIISSQAILTAARCVYQDDEIIEPKYLSVRIGSTNQLSAGVIKSIKSITPHPDYSGYKNNLAILFTDTPIIFTDRIQGISLSSDAVQEGNILQISGWGVRPNTEFGYKLHTNSLRVTSDEICRNAYPDHDDSTFCMNHKLDEGNCIGDAGNGAARDRLLYGIANFVIGSCGSRYPDVYTNLLPYADWIKSVI